MEQEQQPKWEGKVNAKLKGLKADQVWPLLQDFFNLHKWFPTLSTCYGLEGVNGQPGCIRYCAGSSMPSNGSIDGKILSWSIEKLLSIDPIQFTFTYELLDGNIGFESYVSTMRLLTLDEKDDKDGCLIEWSFVVNPVKGWKLENLIEKYQKGLERMAKKIEEGLVNVI
ncbi:Lachrymatory-factor synthase [Thalictrum thalictroides]|uniref:Lachrymatory-factor synthase n=1 Tax=Thalictrum thalictroides TaxID=46969 RepID=A0A7J6XDI0_THATH|nr:Lachrymatory-factor synthase [Thalictrum thalictroides]